jgi:hypothetical protein
MSASLTNHDGPGGNIADRGIWAKIYNIQSKTWLTTSPLNVNQVSEGDQTESATVALAGLKFLIAFYTDTDPGVIKTRMWTPNSSSDVNDNAWTAGIEESVNTETNDSQSSLKWLKMPKESKVLLTWNLVKRGSPNKIWGQFYDENTGAKIGADFMLLER